MQLKPLLLATFSLLTLTACGLNNQKIAAKIQEDITKNGGTSLKAVNCPSGVKPEAGKTFECVGEMNNGYTFTIAVQQKDAQGNVQWDVPHAKGLVNIPKLESLMQEALNTEIGSRPSVACGGIYKAIDPGSSFDCQVSYKTTKSAPATKPAAKGKPSKPPTPIEITQTEKVTVNTDGDGNVSWQRILPNLAAKPTNTPSTQGSPSPSTQGAKPNSAKTSAKPDAKPKATKESNPPADSSKSLQ